MYKRLLEKYFPATPYPFHIKGRTDVIFVHTPHTAGAAVAKALNCYKPKGTSFRLHNTAQEIISEIGYKKYAGSFKFSFVRNPWDKLYAAYLFLTEVKKMPHFLQYKDFNTWVTNPNLSSDFSLYSQFRSNQVNWLSSPNGKIELDYIGRYENLQADFEKLCAMIHVQPVIISKPVLSDKAAHYREVYTPESKAVVDKLFERDIVYFGYAY